MANARTERSVHMRLIDWARSLTKHRMLVGPGNRYVRAGARKCAHRLASHARVETDRGAWGFASMIKADVMRVDKPQPPPEQREPPVSERLDSWKEIAAYLKRDESTARRWENEGLPVHRHAHKKKATICAYTYEIDTWWNVDRVRLEAVEPAAAVRRRRAVWWAAAGLVLLGVGVGLGLNVAGVRDRLLGRPVAGVTSMAVLPLKT